MSDKFYCMYCGDSASSIYSLTSRTCHNNPESNNHIPYEGSEKDKYTCKYCGDQSTSMYSLTNRTCFKSPNGKHIPSIH